MTKIPFFDLKRQYREIGQKLDAAIRQVMADGFFTLGPREAAFEQAFANYIGTKFGVGVGSGTDAIALALRALGVTPSDEVVVPANAYPTAFAVAITGARLRLVDCQSDGNLNPKLLAAALNQKTKAVVAVHLYGNPADLDAIAQVIAASKHKIYLVEDAAQAHGAESKIKSLKLKVQSEWKRVGGIGDIGCFSFYPTKNLGALGDGGMVLTNDGAIAARLRGLRMYGEQQRYQSLEVSGVSRLDELQASLLTVKLGFLERWNRRRRQIAALYTQSLSGVGDITLVSGDTPTAHACYHLLVIRTRYRDKLKDFLRKQGIGTGIHYPIPIHLTAAFAFLGYKPGDFPVAEVLSQEVLSLPMYPELTDGEVSAVIKAVKAFFQKR